MKTINAKVTDQILKQISEHEVWMKGHIEKLLSLTAFQLEVARSLGRFDTVTALLTALNRMAAMIVAFDLATHMQDDQPKNQTDLEIKQNLEFIAGEVGSTLSKVQEMRKKQTKEGRRHEERTATAKGR